MRLRPNRAFALVELLVVIAIIMILIALLIGPIMRVRRQALVLACPIVAPGLKGSIVIVHPRGGAELELARAPSYTGEGEPAWSSNGTWIGYTTRKTPFPNNISCVAILHVASGKVRLYTPSGIDPSNPVNNYFKGWADDDHFIEALGKTLHIRQATTGQLTQTIELSSILGPGDVVIEGIARVPASTGAYYVTGVSPAYLSGRMIVLLRKDFSIKKTIHVDTSVSRGTSVSPRVDPMGEYVAWTTQNPNGRRTAIVLKSLTAPVSAPPDIVAVSSYGVLDLTFADWREDGNLLVFEQTGFELNPLVGPTYLKTFTRTGKTLHTTVLTTDRGPPGAASYRIYRHQ